MTQSQPATASELLPCPFCGPGQSMVDPWFDDVSKRWTVGCGRCGASSGRSIHAEGSKEAAIKSWNTRAPAQCGVLSESAWQPIEIAPHQKLVLLGWRDWRDHQWCVEVGAVTTGQRFNNGYSNLSQHGSATHWQPLPAGPSSTVSSAEGK